MNKRDSIAVLIFWLALSVVFFVFHINFVSSKLRFNFQLRATTTHSLTTTPVRFNSISGHYPTHSRPLQSPPPFTKIQCTRSHKHYDFCFINGPAVLDANTSTFFVTRSSGPTLVEKIKPYPRKHENSTMAGIKEVTLTSGPQGPQCHFQHNAPALVFSAGGYTGNFFHDFNDGFIPLYIMIHSIFHNQEPILVISKARDWWVRRYADLLQSFSKHPILYLDNDNATHCFPSASVGLISHGLMTINPKLLPNPKTLTHFHYALDKAFGKNHNHHQYHGGRRHNFRPSKPRPRLVLISRTIGVGRAILNQEEVKQAAENVGFDVIVFVPSSRTDMHVAYEVISKSHAMVGVHGAALTHLLFLRPGAVLMQLVPLGTNWLSKACYEEPARAMGLVYIDYRINQEESSLVDQYGKDDIVVKDPLAKMGSTWSLEIMKIYLKDQNVRLDLERFTWYLKAAYDKAKIFMDRQG